MDPKYAVRGTTMILGPFPWPSGPSGPSGPAWCQRDQSTHPSRWSGYNCCQALARAFPPSTTNFELAS